MKTLLTILFLSLATSAWAMPLDYMTTVVNPVAGTVAFTLQFDGAPDFQTVDSAGRQADSFQLYVYNVPGLDSLSSNAVTIIRGEELHYDAGLPLRNVTIGSDYLNDPHGGGWGSIREVDTVQLVGDRLTWTSSLEGLGVSSTFGYGHETFRFGNANDGTGGDTFFGACSSDRPCAAPEPGGFWPMFLGLWALVATVARYGLRRQP